VLDALDYAHREDTIHRDIKPANVLIETHTKRPIIVDFGIAKVTRGPEEQGGAMIQGTPVYMPPEQILNDPVDGRADIYAAGIMLFEMLVSNLPLPAWNSAIELLQMKLQHKNGLFQKKPSEMNRMVHREMDRIVFKAISFDPENRFATCRDFLERLREYRERFLKNRS
ncbi:MAG: hypothetical protein DRH37_11505, partial [Deltaproteobacteria bacterium]